MSLRINTNLASLGLQNALQNSEIHINRSIKNLATGTRLSDPSQDIAATAVAANLTSDISAQQAASRNAEVGQSFASVAEGSLSEQSDLVLRMRELAIQAASDTYSDREREFIQNEFQSLQSETERIAQSTSFGSQKLLNGSGRNLDIQVGTKSDKNSRISFNSSTDTTLSGLSIAGSGVASKSDARDTLESLDAALDKISAERSKYGAVQSRLESAQNVLSSSIENTSSAKSKLSDTDIAHETSELRRQQILQQYQTTLLQQSNDRIGVALKLIA
jgi:flagellin